jgi:hypothetical protein
VTKAIIAIGTDRGTTYNEYIRVQSEIEALFHELWNTTSIKQFGQDYKSLPDDKQKAVRNRIPMRIVEMDPAVDTGYGIYRRIQPYVELIETK